MKIPARVEYEDHSVRIATWRNVVVMVWRGGVKLEQFDHVARCERALKTKFAQGIVPFTIVTEVPTEFLRIGDAERKRAADLAAEMASVTIAHVNVVLGTGFWAAAVRGVISTAQLVSRTSYPNKTVDSVRVGCEWVVPMMNRASATAPTIGELCEAIEPLTAR